MTEFSNCSRAGLLSVEVTVRSLVLLLTDSGVDGPVDMCTTQLNKQPPGTNSIVAVDTTIGNELLPVVLM